MKPPDIPAFGLVSPSGPDAEKTSKLEEVLNELRTNIPEIEAAAIVSAEGLPIASKLPREVDESRIAAMTAALLALGERAAAELAKGDLEQVFVRGTEGYIISMAAGENAVLTISANNEVRLGLIFLDMKNTTKQIVQILYSD